MKKITADYTTHKGANDENRDAFFAVEKAITINGPITKTVTLKRPFAQINVATTDVLKAGETTDHVDFTGATSAVTVKDVPTVFSPLTDKLSSQVNALQFASAAIPDGNFAVTGSTETYKYLAVNYVFAPVDGTVYDVEAALKVAGKDVTVKVPSVPAKRNYRTNIYGNLLTTTADFNVVIDHGFAGDENMEMWDGSADAVTEVNGVYEIKNAAQLAWVSQQVNSRATTFSGKTVKLVDDIYLGGKSWTPIGTVVSTPSVAFSGTFDGNGKTIHDLNASDNTPKHSTAGLFGSVVSAIIKDLTIENAIVKSNHYAGVICGYSEGKSKFQNCKVSNVSVTSAPELIGAKWDNGDKVGGIAGYIVSAEVSGCTVDNAAIQGYRDLGGIVGYANSTSKVTGNALKGIVTIIVDKSHNYEGYTSEDKYDANTYVGQKSDDATVSHNTGEASIYYPTAIVSTQEELNAAIADVAEGETTTVYLEAGEYDIIKSGCKGDIVVKGKDKTTTIVRVPNESRGYDNKSISFENVTLNCENTYISDGRESQFPRTDLHFTNCNINGLFAAIGSTTTSFKECTFTANDYAIKYYGGDESSKLIVDKCQFNTHGKGILMFNEAAYVYDAEIINCTFEASAVIKGKAAIQMHTESGIKGKLSITNSSATGFDSSINNGLWNEINNNTKVHTTLFNVTVDGNQVQTAE